MNNKKTLYWIGGIVVIVLVLLLFYSRKRENPADHLATDHSSMNHQTASTQANAGSTATDSSAAHSELDSYLEKDTIIMNQMMQDMEHIDPSGYAAIDFLTGMIPHHEAAVSMSENYLNYGGSNDDLKDLAENIIKVQKDEIKQMEQMKQELKDSGRQDKKQEQEYLKEYQELFADHHMGDTTSSNVEAAFAKGMILHHQMAVEMADEILDYTKEESVITLAKNIIKTQKDEIRQMQRILDQEED